MQLKCNDLMVSRRAFLGKALQGSALLGLGLPFVPQRCTGTGTESTYEHWTRQNSGSRVGDMESILLAAVLAPSPHNTQPWKFHIDRDRIEVFADTARHLGAADPERRMMLLAIGCAIENLCIAAQNLGYHPIIETLDANFAFKSTGHCARIRLVNGKERIETPLGHAMFRRGTARSGFVAGVAPSDMWCQSLLHRCQYPGMGIIWYRSSSALYQIRDAVKYAVREFLSDERRHRDGMKWFRIKRQEWESKGDGISVYNSDASFLIQQYVDWFVTEDDLSTDAFKNAEVTQVDDVCETVETWGLIYANNVSPNDRVIAGRLAERVYLESTVAGYAVQPFSYCTELRNVSDTLKKQAGLGQNSEPLLLFAIGKPISQQRSVRRPLSDVLF